MSSEPITPSYLTDGDVDHRAEANLYANGKAIYFDQEGEQIPELQQHGIAGVHAFVERYPDAPVYWAIWNGARTEIHEGLLQYIRTPEEVGAKTEGET